MAPRKRRDGAPLWIDAAGAAPLARVDLRAGGGGAYDEAWLQRLIHAQPCVLPLAQVEPSFGRAAAVCRELPLAFGGGRTGALDNLLVTPDGGLVLVETKLWRNPEARRTVVAQAMDYAAAIFRLRYEELEHAVGSARAAANEPSASLHELAGAEGALEEAEFVDAVTRNLARGRAVVAVVGDGIREDVLPLAELLQAHAGLRFTFALVELGIYAAPGGEVRLVVPSVLAQTTLIERGVVSVREPADAAGRIVIEPPPVAGRRAPATRAIGIGEDEFYEMLDAREPGLAAMLRAFLDRAAALGVWVDRQSGLNLKHDATEGNPLNLGTIRKDGFVDTGPATWWDRTVIGRQYNEALAGAIGGAVTEMMGGRQSALRTRAGKTPQLSDLLPAHADAWLAAMEAYIRALTVDG